MPDDFADAIFDPVNLSAIQRWEIGGEMSKETKVLSSMWVKPSDKATIQQGAATVGESYSEFAVKASLDRAKKAIAKAGK